MKTALVELLTKEIARWERRRAINLKVTADFERRLETAGESYAETCRNQIDERRKSLERYNAALAYYGSLLEKVNAPSADIDALACKASSKAQLENLTAADKGKICALIEKFVNATGAEIGGHYETAVTCRVEHEVNFERYTCDVSFAVKFANLKDAIKCLRFVRDNASDFVEGTIHAAHFYNDRRTSYGYGNWYHGYVLSRDGETAHVGEVSGALLELKAGDDTNHEISDWAKLRDKACAFYKFGGKSLYLATIFNGLQKMIQPDVA